MVDYNYDKHFYNEAETHVNDEFKPMFQNRINSFILTASLFINFL